VHPRAGARVVSNSQPTRPLDGGEKGIGRALWQNSARLCPLLCMSVDSLTLSGRAPSRRLWWRLPQVPGVVSGRARPPGHCRVHCPSHTTFRCTGDISTMHYRLTHALQELGDETRQHGAIGHALGTAALGRRVTVTGAPGQTRDLRWRVDVWTTGSDATRSRARTASPWVRW
jgi:hypothetical protein